MPVKGSGDGSGYGSGSGDGYGNPPIVGTHGTDDLRLEVASTLAVQQTLVKS
jgi:hypothetical protein